MSGKLLVEKTPHGFGFKLLAILTPHGTGSYSKHFQIFVEDASATTRGIQRCSRGKCLVSSKLRVEETTHGFGLKLLASLTPHSTGSRSRHFQIFVEDARATTRGIQRCS